MTARQSIDVRREGEADAPVWLVGKLVDIAFCDVYSRELLPHFDCATPIKFCQLGTEKGFATAGQSDTPRLRTQAVFGNNYQIYAV